MVYAATRLCPRGIRVHQHGGQIDFRRFGQRNIGSRVQQIDATDDLFQLAKSHFCERHAHLLGDEDHQGDDVFRITGELAAQVGALCRDAHRTSVEVTLPDHHTTGRN